MIDSKFLEGEKVRLDADLAHSSLVTVLDQSSRRLFTWVKSDRSIYSVATYRLSRIISDSCGKICTDNELITKGVEPNNSGDAPSG